MNRKILAASNSRGRRDWGLRGWYLCRVRHRTAENYVEFHRNGDLTGTKDGRILL